MTLIYYEGGEKCNEKEMNKSDLPRKVQNIPEKVLKVALNASPFKTPSRRPRTTSAPIKQSAAGKFVFIIDSSQPL